MSRHRHKWTFVPTVAKAGASDYLELADCNPDMGLLRFCINLKRCQIPVLLIVSSWKRRGPS